MGVFKAAGHVRRIALAAVGFIVLGAAFLAWKVVEMDDSPDPRFIGNHPLLYKLRDGQTKAEVVANLGKAAQARHTALPA